MKTKKIHILKILYFVFLLAPQIINAQESEVETKKVENDYQPRTYIGISFKPIKGLKVSLSPELRFDEDFSLKKYLVETELKYSLFNTIEAGTFYRYSGKLKKDKEVNYYSRLGFFISAEKEFFNFSPSTRIQYYTIYNEDKSSSFLAYKLGVEYELKKLHLTPSIACELYQSLNKNIRYKNRYTAGLDYELTKWSSVEVCYKLDSYINKNRNKHIFCLGYKLKF